MRESELLRGRARENWLAFAEWRDASCERHLMQVLLLSDGGQRAMGACGPALGRRG